MKKLVLSVLAVTVLFSLSGCGSDNNAFFYPTKANITFAVMSSGTTPQAAASSTTGLQYAMLLATVPSFAQISSTTAAGPAPSGVAALPFGVQLPTALVGATKISASALKAAGVFASNSSVSKRTKITGFFVNDKYQRGKDIAIFLVYSSPQTPGAVKVTGSSIDFATLTVSFPAGQLLDGEVFKTMNKGFWEPNFFNGVTQGGLFPGLGSSPIISFSNSASALTNTVPTISQVLLGF